MSSTTKTAVVAGAAAIAAALLVLWQTTTDPPIIIGDGSVLFSHDSIAANSPTELETLKLFHKVRTITVIDRGGAVVKTIDVKNREWSLASAGNQVQINLRPHLAGLERGVVGKCPSPWQGSGTYYTCSASQLTPATLTFTDGNCPDTGSPACPIACQSGYCRLELEYK